MVNLIQTGQTMHKARLEQAEAQSRLTIAQDKLEVVIQRSITGRAAQSEVDMTMERRKLANKNVKSQETRFKKQALTDAEEILKEDPESLLKDFHYGVTATPIDVYDVPAEGEDLVSFVRFLMDMGKCDLIKFDAKGLAKFLSEGEENGAALPSTVTKRKSARLTISGTDKWDHAEKNVISDESEMDAISDFLGSN